ILWRASHVVGGRPSRRLDIRAPSPFDHPHLAGPRGPLTKTFVAAGPACRATNLLIAGAERPGRQQDPRNCPTVVGWERSQATTVAQLCGSWPAACVRTARRCGDAG